MTSLRRRAAAGAQWNAIGTIAVAGLNLVQLAVLAKLLEPEDFGLMAMVLVAVALAQTLADAGVSNVLVYRQDLDRRRLSSLYWLAVGSGVALCAVFEVGAPALASLYGEPRLSDLLRALAVVLVVSACGLQSQMLLQRDLRFRATAIVETATAALSAAVAIALAWAGHGVWALVWGQIVLAASRSASFLALGWQQWRPELRFRVSDVREHLSFGAYQIGERLLNFLGQRADQLLLGVLVGAEGLGHYNLAFNLAMQPVTRINPVLTRVAFPILARVQQSPEKLREGYFTLRRVLTAINAPAVLGLAAVAPVLIPFALGPAWQPSVILVQWLALAALCRAMGNPIGSLLLARGRADLGFRWNVAFFSTVLPAIALGARSGGASGVAALVAVVHVVFTALEYRFLVRPLLGPCLRPYLASVVPAAVTASLMAAVVFFVPFFVAGPWWVTLSVQIVTGALIYAGLNLRRMSGLRHDFLGHAVAERS